MNFSTKFLITIFAVNLTFSMTGDDLAKAMKERSKPLDTQSNLSNLMFGKVLNTFRYLCKQHLKPLDTCPSF